MSTQASVRSIEALTDLRAALAVYSEDTLSTLSSVDMEVRRTLNWLQYDRPIYWQEQLKRRREKVTAAQAEVFRRKLAKTADYTPAYSEQKEILRKAEASLRDAEMRAAMVKKWSTLFQQAMLEYHASTRRLTDFARGDIPRAVGKLGLMVEALEAYLRVAPPSGAGASPGGGGTVSLATIVGPILDDDSNEPPPAGGEADAAGPPRDEPPGTPPAG
jgi:hypothetical protein